MAMMKAAVFVEPGRIVLEDKRVTDVATVTHRFKLDDIERAYELFGHQRDGALKVAITP